MAKAKPLNKIFDRIFTDPRLKAQVQKGRVSACWAQAVGSQIAKMSKPIAFRNGELHVKVDSASWRNELTMMQLDLQKKINALLGEDVVKRIVFR